MRMRIAKWLSGFGVMLVIGTFVMANYGTGIPQAWAQAAPPNPLTVIIEKLNQIQTALGGVQEGNHTLRWDTNNPSASRFVTAFTGAVLDKNTGLVWESTPDATPLTWDPARRACVDKTVGGTDGWRLPSVMELRSVQDPSVPAPFVPATVFTNVLSSDYWSASTDADNPVRAWFVAFRDRVVNTNPKTSTFHVWCVRGGMNADQY